MAERCYKVTRKDGEDFGTFDRSDDAQQAADDYATEHNYRLRWTKRSAFAGQASWAGRPDKEGAHIFAFDIASVPCE